ncbi:hypothetical protein QUF54_01045 [Candidatus Marithioploca araucensis]|uniref:Adhesin domain-containing protein n=1 Tax=Candidatus Marithioploca araucensis TaxID=70273 RepID=A0ABT7VQH7_9GAMM|nr:hypothetical protein [Candidatus Marithioploca araucensis]
MDKIVLSNTFTAGEGGTITLSAPLLDVENKGTIQAATQLDGKGGHISLNVDTLHIHKGGLITTETIAKGTGGSIKIQSNDIQLTEKSSITADSLGLGNAGNILMHIEDSLQMQNSTLKTETISADGGNLHITSPGYLYLTNSEITTSVQAIHGNGGNTTLKPEFIVLNKSHIKADASRGKGGNIQITTTGIYNFSGESINKIITASSQLGIQGEINIKSPDINLDEFLVVLPNKPLEAKLIRCNIQDFENLIHLRIIRTLIKSPPFLKY